MNGKICILAAVVALLLAPLALAHQVTYDCHPSHHYVITTQTVVPHYEIQVTEVPVEEQIEIAVTPVYRKLTLRERIERVREQRRLNRATRVLDHDVRILRSDRRAISGDVAEVPQE